MATHSHRHPAPVETESGVFAKVAALLLGILVAVLGFFALLMWADARESRDATTPASTTPAPDHNVALPLSSSRVSSPRTRLSSPPRTSLTTRRCRR